MADNFYATSAKQVTSIDGISGDVTLVAGSNITITDNTTAKTITIASSGGGGGTTYSAADVAANLGMAASVASSALTVALKQSDGSTNPSTGTSKVSIGFRGTTSANGDYAVVDQTGALSIVVPSGATLGTVNATAAYLWVYAVNDGGTMDLAISSAVFDDGVPQSMTQISAGATSASVLYSTAVHSGAKPIRLIARLKVTEATAGTWATAPSNIKLLPVPQVNMTDWVAYTPTGTWNTNVTYSGFWRRVGDSMEIMCTVKCTGAPNQDSLTMAMPAGYLADLNKIPYTNQFLQTVGTGHTTQAGVKGIPAEVIMDNTGGVLYFYNASGSGGQVNSLTGVPIAFGINDAVSGKVATPILGWTTYGP